MRWPWPPGRDDEDRDELDEAQLDRIAVDLLDQLNNKVIELRVATRRELGVAGRAVQK